MASLTIQAPFNITKKCLLLEYLMFKMAIFSKKMSIPSVSAVISNIVKVSGILMISLIPLENFYFGNLCSCLAHLLVPEFLITMKNIAQGFHDGPWASVYFSCYAIFLTPSIFVWPFEKSSCVLLLLESILSTVFSNSITLAACV